MVGRWSLVERKMVPENSRKLLTTRSVGGPQWSVLSHSRDGRHLIAGFSKTWQLTPKQPWWMNSTSGKRNNMYFDFGGNCPFNPTGACPIFTYQSEESMSACQGLKQFWSFFFYFQAIITLILATDMARHGEILDSFKQKVDNFDFTNEEHVTCVCTHVL